MDAENTVEYFFAPAEAFLNSSLYITWAGHSQCFSDFSEGPKVVDSYIMLFVLNGKGYAEFADGKSRKLAKGDFLFYYPKQRHYYYADPDDPMEIMWLYFHGTHSRQMMDSIGLTPETPLYHHFVTQSIQRTMQTIIHALGFSDDENRLAATGEAMVLFSYIAQSLRQRHHLKDSYKQESAISRVTAFIEENYYLYIGIETLCKYVNYSRSYLSRLFKKEVKMTIPEYINSIRIQHARMLISDSQMSLREISLSVGFNDPYYFSKVFKKYTGLSPSDYRRKNSPSQS